MTVTKVTRSAVPRVRGLGEIAPLSLEQYHRMIETGILDEDDPVELHNGYIVSLNKGMGYDWPAAAVPLDVPRLYGDALLWPLSLDQYHRMIAAGILGEDDPIELLDGYLVLKDQGRGPGMGHGPGHATAVSQVHDVLRGALGNSWVVRSQLPISLGTNQTTGTGKEPEPDAAVAQGPRQRYTHHHPGPQDLRLVAEVADSSLVNDRRLKGPLYASAGIALYWIVNLVDRCLEVYSDPDPATGQYRSQQTLAEDQQVVLSWPGLAPVTFAVKDFLP
jgi:Uma2 family endonuclease